MKNEKTERIYEKKTKSFEMLYFDAVLFMNKSEETKRENSKKKQGKNKNKTTRNEKKTTKKKKRERE